MKITIVGNGNMAEAIASKLIKTYSIEVVGRDLEKLKKLKSRIGDIEISTFPILKREIVILAVKPYAVREVSEYLEEIEVLISVLAGTDIETLTKYFRAESYIRAMPNLSASFGESMTAVTGDISGKEISIELLSKIGSTIWLNSEDEIDIATAIAGSGPAYLSLVAEALADGGVKAGLKREDAQTLVKGLFQGFPKLLETPNVKDRVMSPKGTTAYGYSALEKGNVRYSFISAVEEAYRRAVSLRK
jgi:pyrroline-5-carboxylate reductase